MQGQVSTCYPLPLLNVEVYVEIKFHQPQKHIDSATPHAELWVSCVSPATGTQPRPLASEVLASHLTSRASPPWHTRLLDWPWHDPAAPPLMQATPLLALPNHLATSCPKHPTSRCTAPFTVLPGKLSRPVKLVFGLSLTGSSQWLFPHGSRTVLHKARFCGLAPAWVIFAPGTWTPSGRHLACAESKWAVLESIIPGQDFITRWDPTRVLEALHDSGHSLGSFLDPRARARLRGPVSSGRRPSTESLLLTAAFSRTLS